MAAYGAMFSICKVDVYGTRTKSKKSLRTSNCTTYCNVPVFVSAMLRILESQAQERSRKIGQPI